MHGPVLWTSPVTISHFLCVPHYYWGAGRPEWVSGSIPTVVPCPPSGLQFRLHVGYRTTSVQSLNQYQIDLGLYDTFSLNRIYNFVLSCYSNTQNSSFKVHEIQQISVPFVTYIHSRGPCSSVLQLSTHPIYNTQSIMTNYTSPVYISLGWFSYFWLW